MKETNKILVLIAIPNFDYSNEKSAVLSYLSQIKEALTKEGNKVSFALVNQSSNSPETSEIKTSWIKNAIKGMFKLWPWFYYSVIFKRYFKDQDQLLQDILNGERFDQIIEFHTVGSIVGASLAKEWGAKFSVIFDSPVDEQFEEMHGTKSMHWKRIQDSERISMEAADKIMVYSPACQDHVKSKYNIKGVVNILPSLLNKEVDFKRVETETFNIGFIGSFLSWHKIEMMVRVFRKFNQQYSNSKLLLIGYGVEWQNIKKIVEQLGMNDVVEIPGFVSEEELSALKSRFTIAVMPGSNWYGSPLKLFEYAQAGIPFVAPVSKTVSSVFVKDEHCLYVEENNEEKTLFNALERYYKNPIEAKEMGNHCRDFVAQNFNVEIYSEKLNTNLG